MIYLMILLGFGLTIFIHELGHYLLARWAGVRVEVFSVGIGPRLFKIRTDRHGTDWIIALLPLGGYVKMRGQEDMPKAVPKESPTGTEGGAPEDEGHFQSKKPYQRMAIILAGVTFNAIFSTLLLAVAFTVGVPFEPNRLAGVDASHPNAASGFQRGDEVIEIAGKPVRSWEDVMVAGAFSVEGKEVDVKVIREGKEVALRAKGLRREGSSVADFGFEPFRKAQVRELDPKGAWYATGLRDGMIVERIEVETEGGNLTGRGVTAIDRLVRLHPGARMTVFVRGTDGGETSFSELIGKRSASVRGFQTVAVVDPLPGGPSAQAGVKSGDRILAIEGREVRGFEDVPRILMALQGELASSPGKAVEVKVRRDEKEVTLAVVPVFDEGEERFLLKLAPSARLADDARTISHLEPWLSSSGRLRIGDRFLKSKPNPNGVTYVVDRFGSEVAVDVPSSAIATEDQGFVFKMSSVQKLVREDFFTALLRAPARAVGELQETVRFLGRLVGGGVGIDMVGGPLRIVEMSYVVAAVKGWGYFLLLYAKIGFGLAIMNLLPIPVLDGGHAVLILYEMIFRRPPPEKVVRVLQIVGLVLLLALFAFVMFNDVTNFRLENFSVGK